MHFSHVSIGGGISGIETIISIFNEMQDEIKKSKNKSKKMNSEKIIFAIIDKNPANIPGGVGYGFDVSQYGYFNNPIRLSPKGFTKWLLKKKVKKKIINYLKIYGGNTGKVWIKKNKKILFSLQANKLKELYIPRVVLNFWMEERLCSLLLKIKKNLSINFDIKFFKGDVVAIKNYDTQYKKLIFKNGYCKELNYKTTNHTFKKLSFQSLNRNFKILSKIQSIGLGLPPPKQLATKKAQKNKNYIWDFYAEGSTALLKKKILHLIDIKKKIVVYFIGYKAGLLESLPELEKVIFKKKANIEIICSSKELKSIQKAKLSSGKRTYKLKILKRSNLHKVKKANNLYFLIKKEFNNCISKGYNKYDAWTEILENNILNKCISNFSAKEKKIYNNIFHTKIRNITRFTYPETILAREKLSKMKILKTNKELVKKVDIFKKKLIVKTINNKNKTNNYICDIVVNVSGPLNVVKINNEIPLIKSLKNCGAKVSSGGFLVNNNFKIKGIKNIYTSGILAHGFNPERKTIIQAILKNSELVGKDIAKTLIKH